MRVPLSHLPEDTVDSHNLDQTVEAVKQWFDDPKNDCWLIIYDNYDNPILSKGGRKSKENETEGGADITLAGYDIRPFLPSAYHGAILITTRSSRVELGHRIPLQKLKNIQDNLDILSYTSNRKELHKGNYNLRPKVI